MLTKPIGFALFSLLLLMVTPAFADVTSIDLEKSFYTDTEFITFVGTQDEKDPVTIVIHDALGNFKGLVSDPNPNQREFSASSSFTLQKVLDIFDGDGIYNATTFTDDQKQDNGIILKLEYKDNKVLVIEDFLLALKSIPDYSVKVEKTITFTASLVDSSVEDIVFSLRNQPIGATIDPNSGKFVWTVSGKFGSFQDVPYSFDIVVKSGSQEDRESITIIVKQVYVEPEIITESTEPEPEIITESEQNIEEPEFGECGKGTKLIDGKCTIIAIESKGGGCLIATAAYGSEMASQVQFLREIRDNQLMNSDSGISFMTSFNQFYYSFSPTIADI